MDYKQTSIQEMERLKMGKGAKKGGDTVRGGLSNAQNQHSIKM